MKKAVWFLAFILVFITVSSAGFASTPGRDPVEIANNVLDRLTSAYVTENIPLFLSLFDDPTVASDITRNLYEFYPEERFQQELGEIFGSLSGITCEFSDRQISSEKDVIMVRTFRTVGCNEMPILAKVELLLVMRKPSTHRTPWNYIITDQILLTEEYIPVANTPESVSATTIEQTKKSKKKHHWGL